MLLSTYTFLRKAKVCMHTLVIRSPTGYTLSIDDIMMVKILRVIYGSQKDQTSHFIHMIKFILFTIPGTKILKNSLP